MEYRVNTYKTFLKTVQYVEQSIFTYGEWIIYENNSPKYHVSCFGDNSKSDKIINELIESGNFTIESIIKTINQGFNKKLNFGKRPFLSIRTNSEIAELHLKPIPIRFIENLVIQGV